ncbi:MAG: NAD-dependent epimerase/dehydratase family protein, partial [Planctomycetota bacterium]
NLYGPGDDYHPEHSHVIGALIRKFVNAVDAGESTVTCWGSGAPTREFLYVDDCAEGVVRAAERLDEPIPVNLGTGQEVAIRELAETIAELVGFKGELEWDTSRPDGQPRRSLDSRRARQLLGFEATVSLKDGLKTAIADYHAYKAAHETQQPAMAGA